MAGIQDKIADTFTKDNPEYEYKDSYLAELRTNWRENEKAITRSSGLIVILSVAFELIYTNKASTTSFFGFKLANISIAEFSLAVIIGYLFYSTIYSFLESQIFFDIHNAIMRRLYSKLSAEGGEIQLSPVNSLTGSTDRVSNAMESSSLNERLATITGGIRVVTILFGPPLFIIAAYIQLFIRYGLGNSLLWGSLAITAVLLIAGGINVYLLAQQART